MTKGDDEMADRTLAEALLAAQKAMEQPKLTATNPHFKSKFAPLDECLRVALEALNAEGVALIQPTVSREDGRVGVQTIVMGHGDTLDLGTLVGNPPDDPQKIGSWLTYFRRYAVNSALGRAGEEDDDGNRAAATQKGSGTTKGATKQKAESDEDARTRKTRHIHALRNDLGLSEDEFRERLAKAFETEHLSELSLADLNNLATTLTKQRERMRAEQDEMPESVEAPSEDDDEIPF